jgi:galactokinase
MSIPNLDDRLTRLLRHAGAGRSARDDWHAWFVPGRIEILGKHTDYAGGRSLIAAVERGICAIAAPRTDGRLSVTDASRPSSVLLEPEQLEPPVRWATYPLTVLRRLNRNFPGAVHGADVIFDSDLPSASGLSSSSALMIAVLLSTSRVNRLDATGMWIANITSDEDLAAYAATIENGSGFRDLEGERGVGTQGGSEDHTAILCSRPGEIAQYSFRPTRRERTVIFPAGWTFAIGVSGVRARKTGNARDAYNRAAERVNEIVKRWRDRTGRTDETLADAIASSPDAADRLKALLREGEPALADRLDQFLEEAVALVPRGGEQLQRGDIRNFGETALRSQALAERLLRNQVPETISLARLAREHGASAASAFGAGFGGSVWALVESSSAHAFLDRWQNAYRTMHPDAATRASFFLSTAGRGVTRFTREFSADGLALDWRPVVG